jgi:hypothetical protein
MTFDESMRPQPNLLAKAMAGPLSRRALIKKSTLLGVSAPFVVGLLVACGYEDDVIVAVPGDEPDAVAVPGQHGLHLVPIVDGAADVGVVAGHGGLREAALSGRSIGGPGLAARRTRYGDAAQAGARIGCPRGRGCPDRSTVRAELRRAHCLDGALERARPACACRSPRRARSRLAGPLARPVACTLRADPSAGPSKVARQDGSARLASSAHARYPHRAAGMELGLRHGGISTAE